MKNGRLGKYKERALNASIGELADLFGQWVPLDDCFSASRRRLFSPRTHLLAFSIAGTLPRWRLP